MLPTILGVSVVVFSLSQLVPGDPAAVFLGENATPEAVEELRRELGLDRPLLVRLLDYLVGLARLDLGRSIFQNESVVDLIARRLPATIELTLSALLFAVGLGVALGIVAALKHGTFVDTATMVFAQLGVSVPVFWLGILLMAWLAVGLGWFPAVGRGESLATAVASAIAGRPSAIAGSLRYLFLPALTLGLNHAAVMSRLVRSSMLEALREEFVRVARAKGLTARRVIFAHGLRNALIPVVSVAGIRLGTLFGGSVLTESIFGWPGVGQLAVTAISQRDFPLVQGIVLAYAAMFLMLNLLVDLLYGVIDPRIRLASPAEGANV
jgi:peptide/nickel transport system permease protein